ncbi:MAG: allophanate hydrolase subunit 1 [Actinomycetota bacterium]|nr:allophanate hydrolase subunit 1 [Actinomycetota bacterium]
MKRLNVREVALFGDRARIVRFTGPPSAEHLKLIINYARRLRELPGVIDANPGHLSVLVEIEEATISNEQLSAIAEDASPIQDGRSFKVRADYAGPDLGSVAAHNSLTIEQVIAIHSSGPYLVSMIGSPGFIYLAGLDPRLAAPRREQPRPSVGAGTVAIGGAQTGVYGLERPGGWNLIATLTEAIDCEPGDYITFLPA